MKNFTSCFERKEDVTRDFLLVGFQCDRGFKLSSLGNCTGSLDGTVGMLLMRDPKEMDSVKATPQKSPKVPKNISEHGISSTSKKKNASKLGYEPQKRP